MKLYFGNMVTTVTTFMIVSLVGFVGYSISNRSSINFWGRRSKSNHRMGIVTGRCKAGGGRNRCGKYSLTESPFPDRLYKKWKVGRRGTKICIRR